MNIKITMWRAPALKSSLPWVIGPSKHFYCLRRETNIKSCNNSQSIIWDGGKKRRWNENLFVYFGKRWVVFWSVRRKWKQRRNTLKTKKKYFKNTSEKSVAGWIALLASQIVSSLVQTQPYLARWCFNIPTNAIFQAGKSRVKNTSILCHLGPQALIEPLLSPLSLL